MVFIKYCVFPINVVIFLNSAISAAALVFYLSFSGPSMKSNVHTEEKLNDTRVRNIFQNFRKTQYLMNTLYVNNTKYSDIFLATFSWGDK